MSVYSVYLERYTFSRSMSSYNVSSNSKIYQGI